MPVAVAVGTDLAHAPDSVADRAADVDAAAIARDVHVPHLEAAAQAMVATDLSTKLSYAVNDRMATKKKKGEKGQKV